MNETFWHLAAYYATVTNGLTNTPVAAITDGILTKTTSNNYILPQPGKLRLMYSAGVSLTRSRINTPALRYVGLPYSGSVNLALAVPTYPNIWNLGEMGPTLPTADEISVEHTLGGGAPEAEFSLVWFNFGMRAAPPGPVYRMLYTAAITCAAGTWVSGSMTADSTLPAGRYAIVGMGAIGTNLAAARLIFPGGGYRPGCLASNTVGLVVRNEFTDQSMGLYGTFDSVNTPSLEAFSIGACTAQTVFLDLVRIGNR